MRLQVRNLPALLLTVAAFGILLAAACSVPDVGLQGSAAEATTDRRRPEPPGEYASLKNPYEDQAEAISEGGELYQANCSSCHGNTGRGDGPAAAGLNPRPQDLSLVQASLDDGYLYWRISEGGLMEPFGSVMPAWKGLLDQQKIWQIITYLRTLG
jgi:mono/diheme cytochrome c family protein